MNYNNIEQANKLHEQLKDIISFLENANNEGVNLEIRYHANRDITSSYMALETDTETFKSFLTLQKESLIKQLEKLGVDIPKQLKK